MLIESSIIVYLKLGTLQKCYDNKDQFNSLCTNQFHGVADATRCFFLVSYAGATRTWSDAWNACKKYGGAVAQIHTNEEYGKIAAYAQVNNFL